MSRRRRLRHVPVFGLALLSVAFCHIVAADGPTPRTPPSSSATSASSAPSAPEADLPSLKPGMWEYQRTRTTRARGTPAQAKLSKCSDPTLEMRNKIAELRKKGCRFSAPVHLGNTYRASWMCPSHGGVVAMSQVLTVTSDSSYEDIS